jgi:hypothetical protein
LLYEDTKEEWIDMTIISKPKNLEKLLKEGFVYDSPIICPMYISDNTMFLQVYKKTEEHSILYALYLKHEDKVIQKYKIEK